MKRINLVVLIITLLYSSVEAQQSSRALTNQAVQGDLSKNIIKNIVAIKDSAAFYRELNGMISEAIAKNNNLRILDIEKYNYDRNKTNINSYYELIRAIDDVVFSIEEDRKNEIKGTLLNEINNPVSDTLGFKFTDEIDKIVQDRIQNSTAPESEKKRIKGTFGNLLSSLGKAIPAINVITNVITAISQIAVPRFSDVNVKIAKGGQQILKSYDSTTTLFNKDEMMSFRNKLEPYISFYSKLNQLSSSYINDLNVHNDKYSQFAQDLENIKRKFGEIYGVDFSKYNNTSFNKNFKDDEYQSIIRTVDIDRQINFYKSVNNDQLFSNMPNTFIEITELTNKFNDYFFEYILIFDRNVKITKSTIDSAQLLPVARNNITITGNIQNISKNFNRSHEAFKRQYTSAASRYRKLKTY